MRNNNKININNIYNQFFMEIITTIIESCQNYKNDKKYMYIIYKYLINIFCKEDVDLVLYDKYKYECD